MALVRDEINPLNVLGQRRLAYIPPHFSIMTIVNTDDVEKIDQWIYYHLNSRYCIRVTHELDKNKKIKEIYEIGLEDAKELTMLSLACPYLHKN